MSELSVGMVGDWEWLATMSKETGFRKETIPDLISEARKVGGQTVRGVFRRPSLSSWATTCTCGPRQLLSSGSTPNTP